MSKWESIEQTSGPFNIGYATGSLCYLIDNQGRVRSEGYHEIQCRKKRAGPPDNYEYTGKRGASENRISPISEHYLGVDQ